MSHRCLASKGVQATVIAVVSLAPALVAGQVASSAVKPTAAANPWTPPRTPWGEPDLQGMWDFQSTTPLERPRELTGKEVLTDEEAAEFERRALQRNSVDRRDGGAAADLARSYGEVWYNRNPVRNTRTSLVVDPPDGRIPSLMPEAEKKRAARAEYRRAHPVDSPDSWEDLSTYSRCISRVMPRLPQGYNSGTLILQTPGWVVESSLFLVETLHGS